MKELKRDAFISKVRSLNLIIREISYENAYQKVVEFFRITSSIQDRMEDVYKFPLRGWSFLGIKSRERKQAEIARSVFMSQITSAGRSKSGPNRTERGEAITKFDVYFGGIYEIPQLAIADLEAIKAPGVQEKVRAQIEGFVVGYKHWFNTDWLRKKSR